MDPCPFLRIAIANLSLKFPPNSHLPSFSHYCKIKFKGFPTQFADVSHALDTQVHGSFLLSKPDLEKLAAKSTKFSSLKIEIHRRSARGCVFGKLLGYALVHLDLRGILDNMGKCVIQNGWVVVGNSGVKLHLNVRADPDPRFVFLFDGEPECSPQIFQANGNVRQPVFTCKFGLRNSTDRSRSSLSEPSTSASCFGSGGKGHPIKERKGWSITIHDLSGSPVAAASMVTPFVPSPGTDRVSRSNPGAWLVLRPGHSTWNPWGRLEAWSDGDHLGHRFDLIPDGGIDTITLANSTTPTKTGGKFTIDVSTGSTLMTSPNSSFDLSSGSDLGSASGSGSWAHLLYRGFVMSSTVQGNGRPEVEVGVQHVSCTEDAAAFVALAAAMDLSMDACRPFSRKLRKELRQPDVE
ncbi:hypothetical protein AAHA92_06878 [Salvia divinorum]|uniref:Uncharacterized protein n=1 Tax=Salvia divinorum TaxID=28513 RepID=A0ABD1IB60_SALDI